MHIDRSHARTLTHIHTIANNQQVDISIREEDEEEEAKGRIFWVKDALPLQTKKMLQPSQKVDFLTSIIQKTVCTKHVYSYIPHVRYCKS
jgi:hypothetical protein